MTDTDKIEADLNRSRHALNDTIDQLGGKLSPGQIVDEALGLAQGQLGHFTANLGRQVRDNPVPLLLIGAGIGMLMMNARKDHPASLSDDDWRAEHHFRKIEQARANSPRIDGESEEDYGQRLHEAHVSTLNLTQHAGEAFDAFKARVSRTVEGMERRARHVRDSLQAGISKAGAYAGEKAKDVGAIAAKAKGEVGAFYDDNPLAAGAIGLAVGALIGSVAPLSGVERGGLRGMAGQAARTAADLAERGAGAVQKAATNFVH